MDYIFAGIVVQESPQLSNIARTVSQSALLYCVIDLLIFPLFESQAAVQAGLSDSIPSHTISMGCISSNAAINMG